MSHRSWLLLCAHNTRAKSFDPGCNQAPSECSVVPAMATTRCTPRQDETVAVPVLAATTSSTPRRLRARRLHAESSDACKNGAMRRPIPAQTSLEPARLRENSTSDHKNLVKTVQRRLRARRLRAEPSETHKKGLGETSLSARTPLDSARTPPPITETSQKRTSSRDGGVRSRAESTSQCPGGL